LGAKEAAKSWTLAGSVVVAGLGVARAASQAVDSASMFAHVKIGNGLANIIRSAKVAHAKNPTAARVSVAPRKRGRLSLVGTAAVGLLAVAAVTTPASTLKAFADSATKTTTSLVAKAQQAVTLPTVQKIVATGKHHAAHHSSLKKVRVAQRGAGSRADDNIADAENMGALQKGLKDDATINALEAQLANRQTDALNTQSLAQGRMPAQAPSQAQQQPIPLATQQAASPPPPPVSAAQPAYYPQPLAAAPVASSYPPQSSYGVGYATIQGAQPAYTYASPTSYPGYGYNPGYNPGYYDQGYYARPNPAATLLAGVAIGVLADKVFDGGYGHGNDRNYGGRHGDPGRMQPHQATFAPHFEPAGPMMGAGRMMGAPRAAGPMRRFH
jgi:hypothetical protein